MFKELIEFEKPVSAFAVDREAIYVLCGNDIIEVAKEGQRRKDKHSGFFVNDGRSRALRVDSRFLYCRDFCTSYIIDKRTLQCARRLRLGTDLKSDICGFVSDGAMVYVCIRNGDIITIDKNDGSMESRRLSDTSTWDIKTHGSYLYAGNVEGNYL